MQTTTDSHSISFTLFRVFHEVETKAMDAGSHEKDVTDVTAILADTHLDSKTATESKKTS